MACSHVTSCELFVQFALNPALDLWKAHYCEGDFERCARYTGSSAGQAIPLTLLPNGKNVRIGLTRTDTGTTALFNAILKGRSRMIHSLVRAGVDINDRNLEGLTPLMVAAERGDLEIIAALLAAGADLHATDHDGRTAGDIAVACGHLDAAQRLQTSIARSAQAAAGDRA
jgi:ankyrin repeat protein